MHDLKVADVRPFIPAQDFKMSKSFYTALGWAEKWSEDQLALLENGAHRFYLQAYYQKDWAENTMLHISVSDARACYEQIHEILKAGMFGGARVAEPKDEAYGALVTYVWDPSGVLLHFAQWK